MWVSIEMMNEIELEIPIRENTRISFFLNALKNAEIVETLKFGSEGVTFLCKATPRRWDLTKLSEKSPSEREGMKAKSLC